jgi:hypothetical protein
MEASGDHRILLVGGSQGASENTQDRCDIELQAEVTSCETNVPEGISIDQIRALGAAVAQAVAALSRHHTRLSFAQLCSTILAQPHG